MNIFLIVVSVIVHILFCGMVRSFWVEVMQDSIPRWPRWNWMWAALFLLAVGLAEVAGLLIMIAGALVLLADPVVDAFRAIKKYFKNS